MSILESIIGAIVTLVAGPMTKESVEAKLTEAAAAHSERGLQPNTSAVDLLKVLNLDSSREGRQDLADELGLDILIDGSATSNVALHDAVMNRIASRHWNIPKSD